MMPPATVMACALEGDFEGLLAGLVSTTPATVPRDMTLREFLDAVPIPRWKQKMLVLYERVSITRKQPDGSMGPTEKAQATTELLRAGDQVDPDDSIKGDTFDVEYEGARDAARDYADAPDADPTDFLLGESQSLHFKLGSDLFGSLSGETTLQGFLQAMGRSENVTGPPRNLYILSHAHWSGQLSFAPTGTPEDMDKFFSFESIDAIGTGLSVPGAFLEPRSPANKTPHIVFTGCSFGQAEPFLRRLRDAINPKLAAIAPIYMYGIGRNADGSVYFEYMAKPYTLYTKPVPGQHGLTRAKLIEAMTRLVPAARDAHNDEVKDLEWQLWVPDEPWPADDFFFIVKRELRTALWYEKIDEEMPPVPVTMDEATFMADGVAKYKSAVAALARDPKHLLSTACPFPYWSRFGLPSADKMIDTFEPAFAYTANSGGGGTVVATLGGHRYSIIVPIVARDPARPWSDRRLLMNVYNAPQPGATSLVPSGVQDYPFPKLPLSAFPASNTKFWKVIEPA